MKRPDLLIIIGCCILSAFLALTADRIFFASRGDATTDAGALLQLKEQTLPRFAGSAPTNFINAAEKVTPGVVFVRSFRERMSRMEPNLESSTTGSGVIISPDGLIATNNHVIEGAERIRIVLGDKREFDASVMGVDESTDLALLSINGKDLPNLEFGNSDSLQIGEWVLAVGNPFNLNSTVTAGIVSAKGRSIDVLEPEDRIESFIQTDAAVNPGNSGGALVNTNGELIGINTAIITNSGRHEGYAFAIPGNLALRVLNDLRDFGEVKRAVLGVYIQGVNDAQAKRLGLGTAKGVLITNLTPDGAALRAGLEIGDVMTALNGVDINSAPEMQEQLSRYRPGERLRITYLRNGRERKATALLRDKANRTRSLVSARVEDRLHQLGFEVRSLTPQEAAAYPEGGVRVIAIFRDTPIEATNMNADFIIQAINDRRIQTMEQFMDALNGAEELLFQGVYEGYEGEYYYQVE
ncbi:S1C family serine protease [Lewinella sp. W8]|uniref:S1C family serine protease n=1 Tax=Lewinella sp. W8 TaxID=2528208 RepID=UPI0010686DDF|nr:trypsin-like peptidase domain-containing protein [Lewinella sp. W8]MTB51068.1 PDZ domain-containing protein [Lewinella sp. W8]